MNTSLRDNVSTYLTASGGGAAGGDTAISNVASRTQPQSLTALEHDHRHLDRIEAGLGLGSLAAAEEAARIGRTFNLDANDPAVLARHNAGGAGTRHRLPYGDDDTATNAPSGIGDRRAVTLNQHVTVTRAARHTFGATGFDGSDSDNEKTGDGTAKENAGDDDNVHGPGAKARMKNKHSRHHEKTFGSTFSQEDRLKSSIAVAQLIAKSAKELGKDLSGVWAPLGSPYTRVEGHIPGDTAMDLDVFRWNADHSAPAPSSRREFRAAKHAAELQIAAQHAAVHAAQVAAQLRKRQQAEALAAAQKAQADAIAANMNPPQSAGGGARGNITARMSASSAAAAAVAALTSAPGTAGGVPTPGSDGVVPPATASGNAPPPPGTAGADPNAPAAIGAATNTVLTATGSGSAQSAAAAAAVALGLADPMRKFASGDTYTVFKGQTPVKKCDLLNNEIRHFKAELKEMTHNIFDPEKQGSVTSRVRAHLREQRAIEKAEKAAKEQSRKDAIAAAAAAAAAAATASGSAPTAPAAAPAATAAAGATAGGNNTSFLPVSRTLPAPVTPSHPHRSASALGRTPHAASAAALAAALALGSPLALTASASAANLRKLSRQASAASGKVSPSPPSVSDAASTASSPTPAPGGAAAPHASAHPLTRARLEEQWHAGLAAQQQKTEFEHPTVTPTHARIAAAAAAAAANATATGAWVPPAATGSPAGQQLSPPLSFATPVAGGSSAGNSASNSQPQTPGSSAPGTAAAGAAAPASLTPKAAAAAAYRMARSTSKQRLVPSTTLAASSSMPVLSAGSTAFGFGGNKITIPEGALIDASALSAVAAALAPSPPRPAGSAPVASNSLSTHVSPAPMKSQSLSVTAANMGGAPAGRFPGLLSAVARAASDATDPDGSKSKRSDAGSMDSTDSGGRARVRAGERVLLTGLTDGDMRRMDGYLDPVMNEISEQQLLAASHGGSTGTEEKRQPNVVLARPKMIASLPVTASDRIAALGTEIVQPPKKATRWGGAPSPQRLNSSGGTNNKIRRDPFADGSTRMDHVRRWRSELEHVKDDADRRAARRLARELDVKAEVLNGISDGGMYEPFVAAWADQKIREFGKTIDRKRLIHSFSENSLTIWEHAKHRHQKVERSKADAVQAAVERDREARELAEAEAYHASLAYAAELRKPRATPLQPRRATATPAGANNKSGTKQTPASAATKSAPRSAAAPAALQRPVSVPTTPTPASAAAAGGSANAGPQLLTTSPHISNAQLAASMEARNSVSVSGGLSRASSSATPARYLLTPLHASGGGAASSTDPQSTASAVIPVHKRTRHNIEPPMPAAVADALRRVRAGASAFDSQSQPLTPLSEFGGSDVSGSGAASANGDQSLLELKQNLLQKRREKEAAEAKAIAEHQARTEAAMKAVVSSSASAATRKTMAAAAAAAAAPPSPAVPTAAAPPVSS